MWEYCIIGESALPYYSDEIVNEIFSENDIVDYVSQYVSLKKSGRDYSGLCPFHSEKSPSFHVSRDKQLFHCFGCGASGNLVQFVMRMESLDFPEALKVLADKAGIILPEGNMAVNNKLYEKKQRIYKMNKLSARFFYDNLVRNPASEDARRYFTNRGISSHTVVVYGLGYAPDSFNALLNYLKSKGYKENEIVEAGLCANRDGKIYDRFRDRIMFPIIDLRGNVIGFGGRIIREQSADSKFKVGKYINSSETPVYTKGENLYSLNLAKREKGNEIILVEGYMDVISVYQAGIKNIVAGLGTALTSNQAKLLMKYCSEILLCYDSDEAGQNAVLRAIDIINGVGGRSKVIRLQGAKDPDEYIKSHGVDMFKQAVKKAVPSTEYKLMLIKNKHDVTTTDGKIKFVNAAAEALVTVKDTVEVDAYIKKISAETQVSSDAVYGAYKKFVSKGNNIRPIVRKIQPVANKKSEENGLVYTVKLLSAEKKLLNLMSQYKKLFRIAQKKMSADDFSTSIHKKLAQLIYESWESGHEPEPAKLLIKFSGEEVKEVSGIFYNMELYDDEEKTVEELINTIKKEKIQMQIAKEKEPMKIRELLEQLAALEEE